MNNRAKRTFGIVSFIVGIVMFVAIVFMTVLAIKRVSISYHSLKQMDLSSDFSGSITYVDHIYGALGCGIEIDHNDSNKDAQMTAFLESSLKAINGTMLSCSLLYVMVIVTVMAFWLYSLFGQNKIKHIVSIILSVLVIYALLVMTIIISHSALKMPFYFPLGAEWIILAVSILGVISGSCILAWMLRIIRYKCAVAIIAVPLVMLLFVIGTGFEGQLYSSPTVDSFDYVAQEIEPRIYDKDFDGNVYYDEEENVLVLNGEKYEPRQVANPDYLTGVARWGTILFEILSPYAGNGLFMIYKAAEITVSPFVLLLYALKSSVLIVLPALLRKKRGETGELLNA